MTLLTILTLWAIGCIVLAFLNAKFWKIMPDAEQEQYEQNKSQNKPYINPTTKDTWHVLRVFGLIAFTCFVVWVIVNAI